MSPAAYLSRADLAPWLLLAPLAALALALLARRRRARLTRAVGPRLQALTRAARPRARRVAGAAFVGGLLLALLAALHPVFGAPEAGRAWRGLDLVVALDVSRSMLARDLAPDRLGFARAALRALAARAPGDRLGLVVFAGEARLAVPLTEDHAAFLDLVERASPTDVRRGGTDLGAALEASLELLSATRPDAGAVLLLSDGEDLGERALEAARHVGARGYEVHALGLGTPLGSKVALEQDGEPRWMTDASGREVLSRLDVAGLTRVAQATGGTLVAADAPDALARLYERVLLPRARASIEAQGRREQPARYQGLLGAAVLLFLLSLALVPRGNR